jgi:hypothetical protein
MEEAMSNNIDDINKLKHSLMEQFRDELPVLRAKGRLSQENIAEKIGISRQTFNAIETGKREMNWTTFLALVALFQNNEQTRNMIESMDGFNEGMVEIMESSGMKMQ